MNDECIICRAPLEYLEKDEEMECAICHKKENSRTFRIQRSGKNHSDDDDRAVLSHARTGTSY